MHFAKQPRISGGGRPGHALAGSLIGLAIAGAFVVAAVIVQPSLLQGGITRADDPPIAPHRRETFDKLAALIVASAEVLAIHQRGRHADAVGSPFLEIVLRLSDEHDSDFIRPGEVAIISHSRVLQTVMFYSRSERDEETLVTRSEVAAPQFCNRWRLDPHVEPRLIGSGVSDLRARFLHDRNIGGADRVSMEIALIWTGDSSDSEEEAKAVLEVRSRAVP